MQRYPTFKQEYVPNDAVPIVRKVFVTNEQSLKCSSVN